MGDNYMVDEEIESLLNICKTLLNQMHELDMRHRDIDFQLALPLWEGVSCERCKSIHGGVRLYKDNIEEFLMNLNQLKNPQTLSL